MSDEMNTNNGEETAALFVSSQKKKQAEEEARKKAEAEQAKRDAAEAEVRRMEAEVEERRRKAEEERLALEEAARQAEAEKANVAEKIKASVDVEEIKSKVKEKTQGKPKLPILIGAGAAAVVIIVLIVVLAIKGKGSAIDFETLEFAKEYTVTDENNATVTFTYPESVYTEIEESEEEAYKTIILSPEKGKNPIMSVIVSDPILEKGVSGVVSAKTTESLFEELVKRMLEGYDVSDEKLTDMSAETPGKYYYDCLIKPDEKSVGAVTSWIEPNSNGDDVCVIGMFMDKGEDATNVTRLRDIFEEKNSDNALKLPGANPPASADTDGMLEIDAMHMGIIVPKDRFSLLSSDDESIFWADDNGAIYSIIFKEAQFDFDMANEHLDEVQPMLKDLAESAAGLKGLPNLDSRMFLSDSWISNLRYRSEYKDILGDVTYWEANFSSMWRDVRTNKYYIYDLVLMAPNSNQDIYKQLFDKAIDRLQDI